MQSILTKKYLFKTKNFSQSLSKIDILFYSSVYAFILMSPVWLNIDGKQLFASSDSSISGSTLAPNPIVLLCYFLLSGASQCTQAIISFTLLSQTDAVTFSVASQLKRVIIIFSAMIYFGQALDASKALGFIMTGVGLWSYDKAKNLEKLKA
ncbi:hypothetical protein DSO57_1028630 [Entomophthora muscae]|uniref:Uncharacterized protein n=1 Tax=Entomophthora muscae TaxID=34485 RepID=A0ACC2TCN3_9FUNG|nr:hypothetical protein DSO57_1028630 [Entomophthora muscae]